MITYSTNWMGPISIDWFRERGLTRIITTNVTSELQRDILRDSRPDIEIGDTFEREEITVYYSAGRIDIRGLDESEFYNGCGEYPLAPMHGEDWNALSDWLDDLETHHLWTKEQLLYTFELENGNPIRWWRD
jgi:hypothetical protein